MNVEIHDPVFGLTITLSSTPRPPLPSIAALIAHLWAAFVFPAFVQGASHAR